MKFLKIVSINTTAQKNKMKKKSPILKIIIVSFIVVAIAILAVHIYIEQRVSLARNKIYDEMRVPEQKLIFELNSSEEEYKATKLKNIRRKIFANMPLSPAYVCIKVKNIKTGEQIDIICLNTQWMCICLNSLKLVKEKSDYTGYMVDNYDKVFELNDELYNKLKKYEADDLYVDKYKTREDIDKYYLSISNDDALKKMSKNQPLMKLFVLNGYVIRQHNKSGKIYRDVSGVIDEYILRRRYAKGSYERTEQSFIKVRVKKIGTNEEMDIIVNNYSWWGRLESLGLLKINKEQDYQDYIEYMVKNYDRTFYIHDAQYYSYRESGNEADDSFIPKIEINDLNYLKEHFGGPLDALPPMNDNDVSTWTSNNELRRLDNAYCKVFLEHNVVIKKSSVKFLGHITILDRDDLLKEEAEKKAKKEAEKASANK